MYILASVCVYMSVCVYVCVCMSVGVFVSVRRNINVQHAINHSHARAPVINTSLSILYRKPNFAPGVEVIVYIDVTQHIIIYTFLRDIACNINIQKFFVNPSRTMPFSVLSKPMGG